MSMTFVTPTSRAYWSGIKMTSSAAVRCTGCRETINRATPCPACQAPHCWICAPSDQPCSACSERRSFQHEINLNQREATLNGTARSILGGFALGSLFLAVAAISIL